MQFLVFNKEQTISYRLKKYIQPRNALCLNITMTQLRKLVKGDTRFSKCI